MSSKKIWLFLCLLLVLSGCGAAAEGGGGRSAKSAPPPPVAAADAPAGLPNGAAFNSQPQAGFAPAEAAPGAPPAPPPSTPSASSKSAASTDSSSSFSRSEERSAREPSPDSRPGLGTEWGETRTSRVHDVTFVRDSNRPFALATLNYNDRKGVDALANLHAQRDSRRDVLAGGGAVTIAIKDSSGNPLEAVHVGDRTMVIGQAGQRYSITLTNHTNHRFESVVTVDGLDVINGKAGTAENRGYVLLPFATLDIEGFRQSAAAVAAFRFAAVGESYAAQMGAARNVGVIGIAFFGERGDSFVPENETHLRDTASPFPADPRFAQPPRR